MLSLFEEKSCHPGFHIVVIIEASLLRSFLHDSEASGLLIPANINWIEFLTAVCITGKANSNSEFLLLLPLICLVASPRSGGALDQTVSFNKSLAHRI
jgi:hypothetical protein